MDTLKDTLNDYQAQRQDFDFIMKVTLIQEYGRVIDITADLMGLIVPETEKQFIIWSALNEITSNRISQ